MSTNSQSSGRSLLFWVFFLGSFPIAIILLSYASGLRFDSGTRTVVERAALSIETTPNDAAVVVSGAQLEKRTPLVHSLTPGMYTVRIEKDGYQPWEKEVTVERGRSELFSDVILFSTETPISATREFRKPEFQDVTVDDRVLRFLDGPEALLVDDRHETAFIVRSLEDRSTQVRIDSAINAAQWNDSDTLLFATRNALWTYRVGDTKPLLLKRQSLRILDVAWHPDQAYVFYSDLTGLYALERDSRDTRQLWKIADVSDADELVVNNSGDALQYRSGDQYYQLKLY